VIIIWGWRTRLKGVGGGVFFSPAAGRDAPYRLVEARRWFTLFWIPVIPLKRLGTFVECGLTKATYELSVLEAPTTAEFQAQLDGALREVVAAVARADGTITDAERALAVHLLVTAVDGYNVESFDADAERIADAPLADRLTYLASALNEQGKERLLTTAARMLAADGAPDPRARSMVQSIGEQLVMSPAHVHGVIETVLRTPDRPAAE
jgi:hypothetical protein